MKKILLGLAVFLTAFGLTSMVYAAIAGTAGNGPSRTRSQDSGYVQNYAFFAATTTSATSTNTYNSNDTGYFVVSGAKKLVMYFGRGGLVTANTGSTLFKIQVTPDGVNWYDYGGLVATTSTTISNTVVQSTVSVTGTTTMVEGVNISNDGFYGVRCIAVKVTDGEATCSAYAEF